MEWLVFTSIFLQALAITMSCFWPLRPGSMVKGWSGFMGGSGLSSSVNKKRKLYFASDKKIRWKLWFLIFVISFELPGTGNERASSAQGRDGLPVQSWQLWGELNDPIPQVISNHFLLIVLILCPFISILNRLQLLSREDWIQMLLCKRVAGHSLGMEILSCLEHLALGCKVCMDPPSVRLTKRISFDFFPPS